MSILPEDMLERVNTEFKTRAQKNIAIELLTVWTKCPTWTEMGVIGARHERKEKAVKTVIDRLTEADLFTEERGSMYLYRLQLEKETDFDTSIPSLPSVPSDSTQLQPQNTTFMTELPKVSPAGFPLEDTKNTEHSSTLDPEDLGALQNKVYRMEAEIGSIGKQLESIVPVIKGLSAKTPGNPELNPTPQTPQTEEPVIRSPESVDDRIERIEAILKDRSIGDPFDDLSREQILELVRSQPQELLSMASPKGGNPEGRMQATEVTLRPIIVMMTTYTQMLYEKVVHDGYFEGTLSDFLNFAAEQYFTDRGWSLDWNRREPANRRRLG